MKRIFAVMLVLALLCTGCGSEPSENQREVSKDNVGFGFSGLVIANGDLKDSGAEFEDNIVEFQDPVIEEMLRTVLGMPEGDVYRSDLRKIHAIYYRTKGYFSDLQSADGNAPPERTYEWYLSGDISSLEDLALCDNLQWLEFGSRPLPSLEPLQRLPQLDYIRFAQTPLSQEQLEELGQLPHVTKLDLDLRAFSDGYRETGAGEDNTQDGSFLLPLSDQLTGLQVSHKLVWKPEVLSQMTELEFLSINAPDDLGFLKNLPNLRKLNITGCKLKDWSELQKLENLESLSLIDCKGITLDDLRPLSKLSYLGLIATEFTPIAWRGQIIEALPSLTGLYIY